MNKWPSKVRIFPSMNACSAVSGIPRSALRRAKACGCPAFDGYGRIDLQKLLLWMFRTDADLGEDWAGRLARAQALLAEAEQKRLSDSLVALAEVHREVDRCSAIAHSVLTRIFVEELPDKVAGKSVVEIAAAFSAGLHSARLILSKKETYA